MDRSTMAGGNRRGRLSGVNAALRSGRTLVLVGLLTFALLSWTALAPAQAAASPLHSAEAALMPPQEPVADVDPSKQYVFSIGMVDKVNADTLTLRFDDGATETYRVNAATAVQTQNGDELRRSDIEVGEMAIVLSVENDPTAITMVSGGTTGFHDAGPADIRGHDQPECDDCEAHAP